MQLQHSDDAFDVIGMVCKAQDEALQAPLSQVNTARLAACERFFRDRAAAAAPTATAEAQVNGGEVVTAQSPHVLEANGAIVHASRKDVGQPVRLARTSEPPLLVWSSRLAVAIVSDQGHRGGHSDGGHIPRWTD